MTDVFEQKLRELIQDDVMIEQVLNIIAADEQARKADILQRQRDGLMRAKANGIKLGRPRLKLPKKFNDVYTRYQLHQISARKASIELGVSPGTFHRWAVMQIEMSASD